MVIDESLVDFESLLLCRELGYSGVALKACKGHTEALLMGAAAQKYGMFLCVQDLTCPGRSFLHSASLSARIPTVAAIEGNARQYCPAGNRGWAERFPDDVQRHRRHAGHLGPRRPGAGILAEPCWQSARHVALPMPEQESLMKFSRGPHMLMSVPVATRRQPLFFQRIH